MQNKRNFDSIFCFTCQLRVKLSNFSGVVTMLHMCQQLIWARCMDTNMLAFETAVQSALFPVYSAILKPSMSNLAFQSRYRSLHKALVGAA